MTAPAVLGRDTMKKFDMKLTVSTVNADEAISEMLNIDVSESNNNIVDILSTNIDVSQVDQLRFKNLFYQEYLQPERSKLATIKTELRIIVKDLMLFKTS